jgi:hypothetical protein
MFGDTRLRFCLRAMGLLALASLVSSCGLAEAPDTLPPATPVDPVGIPPATRVDPVGTYRHAFTGLALPERYGDFVRLYVTEYDPDKANVSGHYRDAAIRSNATVYHYPATADLSPPSREEFIAHFEQTMGDVMHQKPRAKLLASGGYEAIVNGFQLAGAHARFTLPAPEALYVPTDSHLYLFALDGWYLKFRFSHPETATKVAIEKEQEFIEAVEWPVPGAAEARPMGAASP